MNQRRVLAAAFLAAVASLFLMGSPCGGNGSPTSHVFHAGSIIIPMDNCYQARDTSTPTFSVNCNSTMDDGVYRAYGLVYFLIKHGITVYWTIDSSKDSLTGPDAILTGSSNVVNKWNWSTNAFDSTLFPAGTMTSVTYIGAPFIIDSTQANSALNLLLTDPDFGLTRTEQFVDMHQTTVDFTAAQVRPLTGNPPRIGILNMGNDVNPDVMVAYTQAAGLDWGCDGGPWNDCGGGITGNGPCTSASINAAFPTVVVNSGPGKLYDILCENDFLPDGGLSALESKGYALLWIPHWGATNTSVSDQANLYAQLASIQRFADAGNNVFAECQGVLSVEGGKDSWGREVYQFPDGGTVPLGGWQTDGGINDGGTNTGTNLVAPGNLETFTQFSSPNVQIGDFIFTLGGGALHDWKVQSPSKYLPNVTHLIVDTGKNADIMTASHFGNDPTKGAIVYLGGHNYSPTYIPSWHPNTAGTRLVLNTLFNLGIPCVSPNTVCNTGLPGQCAVGKLICTQNGTLTCAQTVFPTAEICDGLDNNCNGLVDENLSQACYTGDAGTLGVGVCHGGVEICSNGIWGACQGQVLPSAEVCDGLDNNCNGQVDENIVRSCYDGPPGTVDAGACVGGSQSCDAGSWSACTGEVLPYSASCYDGPPGTLDAGICHAGVESCGHGCYGEVTPRPSICNGLDNNCDGVIDTGPCPANYTCSNGACVPSRCTGELGSCPNGYACNSSQQCVPSPCLADGGICQNGYVCSSGSCINPCASANCGGGTACTNGVCQPLGCYMTGCPTGQMCLNGQCMTDPCASLSCPTGTFCRRGDCVPACGYAHCASNQTCSADGVCVTSPSCSPACGTGQTCGADNQCHTDPCAGVDCGGLACKAGACVDRPCTDVVCPSGLSCFNDQCVGTPALADGGPGISPTGGGSSGTGGGVRTGCGCDTTSSFDIVALMAGLSLLGMQKRRRLAREVTR